MTTEEKVINLLEAQASKPSDSQLKMFNDRLERYRKAAVKNAAGK